MRVEVVSCLGSLVQSCCGREGRCRQMSLACVGSTHSIPATLGLPLLTARLLSWSTLLRLQAALYGAGPVLRAFPVFGYSAKMQTRLGLHFVPSPAGAAQAARSFTGALSPGAVRLLPSPVLASVSARASRSDGPCVCSGELVSSHDPPGGCQPSRISGSLWLETGRMFAVW